jgi:AbrB family looped-hinge helix DNA binding protein
LVFSLTNANLNGKIISMTLTLDKMHRLVVPKSLRDYFSLRSGDELEVRIEADGIMLRPLQPASPISMEAGVLVCSSEVPVSAWDLSSFLDQQRDQRSQQIGGL